MSNISMWFVAIFTIHTIFLKAQYDTASYSGDFRAYNMDMWGSGGFDINKYFEFFNEHWNEGGPIDMTLDFFGYKFGPYFDVFTQGDIAMGFGLEGFTTGRIDSIYYPADIKFLSPQSGTFNAGEIINIRSFLGAGNQSTIYPRYPNSGSLFLDYTFGAEFYFKIGICGGPLGCDDTELDFGTQDGMGNYEPIKDTIFKLTTDPTDSSYVYGFKEAPVSIPCVNIPPLPIPEKQYFDLLPVEIEQDMSRNKAEKKKDKDGNDSVSVISNPFLSASLDVPFIPTEEYDQVINGSELTALGEDEYIELQLDLIGIAQTAAGFTQGIKGEIPVIPCVMSIQYSFFNTDVRLGITNHQELTFTPEVNIVLEFPNEVYYEVYNKNGYMIDQNRSDSISYILGNELRLGFPCEYNFMDLKPYFVMGGNLYNHTYDQYDFSLELQALIFKVIIEEIVIIPEFSFPICFWNPFGDDWCETITIPKVAFDKQEFTLGPLWEHSIPLGSLTLDWFDGELELAPFNQIESVPFRIRPVESAINLVVDNVTCHGSSTGMITLSDTGFNYPLTYQWSSGETTRDLVNKPMGEYYVKITDDAGCVSYQGAVIEEPEPLEIGIVNLQHVSCYNGDDAVIEIEMSGGIGPITCLWSTGDTTKILNGLPAGKYWVDITDGECIVTDTFVITQPYAIEAYVADYKHPDCAETDNGFIELNVQGGIEPYSYHWNTLDVANRVKGLPGGDYQVEITDANDCSVIVSHTLVQPDTLTAFLSIDKEVSCFRGEDGQMSIHVEGGTRPYGITWYGTQNILKSSTFSIDSLSGGMYRAKVIDARGCEVIAEREMPTPEERMYSEISEKHVSCFGGNDGEINLTVYNAQGNPAFQWSNNRTTEDIKELTSGKYEVTITDEKGCVAKNNTYLLQPEEIIIEDSIREVSCTDESDGAVSLQVSGGFEPYRYQWSHGPETDSMGSLSEGTYSVTITDANNCTITKEYSLSVLEDVCIDIPNAFTPNNDGYNDTWRIRNIDLYPGAKLSIYTKWGEKIHEAKGDAIKPWNGKYKGKDLPPATYYFVLDLGDGSEITKGSVTIAR